jgi:hypothetical protein
MAGSIFENLQLNGGIINELYGKDMLLINNNKVPVKKAENKPIEKPDTMPEKVKTITNVNEIPKNIPATQRVAPTLVFNEKQFHIIVFEHFLVEKDLIKQVMIKLLDARNKTVQYANVVVWKHDLPALLDCFYNEPNPRNVWVLGIPEQDVLPETPLYKATTINNIHVLFTGCKPALTEQQFKLAIWEFIKATIV